MNTATIVIGCMVILGALGLMTWLVLWSRRTINWIAASRFRSVREIIKGMRRGR